MRLQKDELKKILQDKRHHQEQAEGMRTQNRQLEVKRCKYEEALKENEEVKEKLKKYKSIEIAVAGLDNDLNQFLQERGAFMSQQAN